MHIRCTLAILIFLGYVAVAVSQTLPVGTPVLEDYYRREQVKGKLDPSISFMTRPLTEAALSSGPNGINYPDSLQNRLLWRSNNTHVRGELLPIVWQNQVNTSFPYGWNDGPMIPAKGIQTFISAGFFSQYRWLSVQVRPEFVIAENGAYEGYGGTQGPDWQWYNRLGNRIDLPERFGTSTYTKAGLGQSSIRLTLDPVSIGISTENLWWGPGRRNSILMSNTAPGFFHYTLNTTKPVKTYIGSFEGQIILGRLSKSGFPPSLLGDTARHMQHMVDKPEGKRYLSGITLNYQP